MRHAQIRSDLTQISFHSRFVLHHRCSANDLQVTPSRTTSENLALHAIGEIGVLFVFAPILKRKTSNALPGNRSQGAKSFCLRSRCSRCWRRSRSIEKDHGADKQGNRGHEKS